MPHISRAGSANEADFLIVWCSGTVGRFIHKLAASSIILELKMKCTRMCGGKKRKKRATKTTAGCFSGVKVIFKSWQCKREIICRVLYIKAAVFFASLCSHMPWFFRGRKACLLYWAKRIKWPRGALSRSHRYRSVVKCRSTHMCRVVQCERKQKLIIFFFTIITNLATAGSAVAQ